jgi:predicted HTH transcriptional regulator
MIEGFEEQTAPLTEYELGLVELFVKGLNNHRGEVKAITNAEMARQLRPHGVKVNGARIRKIINYIRNKKIIKNLISSSKGYWIEDDPEKIKKYVKGLRKRASAITQIANSYEDL